MTSNFDGFWARYLAGQQERQKRLPQIKQIIIDHLKAHGIANVIVSYDGEGDSGQTELVTATNADGTFINLDTPTTLDLPGVEDDLADAIRSFTGESTTLYGIIDAFTWKLLNAYHDGFVNNDGGFGELTIDTTAGTVTLSHNDRYVEFNNTTTEV